MRALAWHNGAARAKGENGLELDYLWEIFELDGLSLENGSFHVFYHFFLLLLELIISQFHSVNFLLHGDNFSLTNGWIQSILHLFFKLDFSFPEKNLSLSFNDFSEDVSFLLL